MQKHRLYIAVFALLGIMLAACSPAADVSENNSGSAPAASLIAEGRLLPVHAMDQVFTITGQVEEVFVANGSQVIAGQILANIHAAPEAEAALARAQEETLAARLALENYKSSAEVTLTQGRLAVIVAQNELDAAQEILDAEYSLENRARRDTAKALLEKVQAAQEKLEAGLGIDPDQLASLEARLASANTSLESALAFIEAHKLIATLDGTVVDLSLEPGQRVTPGQPVVTLADFNEWLVKTDNLDELEVVEITVGQAVEVIFDALPETRFQGEVTNINNRYEEKRGDITYTVTIKLVQADPQLRWGMTAAVYFAP